MAVIPEPQNTTAALIDKAHEERQERPRPHLGGSLLGHHCDRWLWLSFRWAVIEKFPGRVLRLFRRGQNEENTIVSDLRAIGVDIRSTGGAQSRVDFGNHVSGSVDGVIHSGLPEAPEKPHVAEFKTHSAKSFKDLCSKGVQKSKPMHWAQMQVYMLGLDIDRAFYLAVNKDDDSIYTERVKLEKKEAKKLVQRGHDIVASDRMPEPCLGASPDWYQCKWCPAHGFCNKGDAVKEANCRTCAHSTAKDNSTWHCARWDDTIPLEAQYQGCDAHVLHPDLAPWTILDSDDGFNATCEKDGKKFVNGEHGFLTSELLANIDLCLSDDECVNNLREKFGGRVVG